MSLTLDFMGIAGIGAYLAVALILSGCEKENEPDKLNVNLQGFC